jgi:hypothetical protein
VARSAGEIVMFEDFKKLYCPHCNAPIENDLGFMPNECPFCKGIISYTKYGTRKGNPNKTDWPLWIKDILVATLGLAAVAGLALYLWKAR